MLQDGDILIKVGTKLGHTAIVVNSDSEASPFVVPKKYVAHADGTEVTVKELDEEFNEYSAFRFDQPAVALLASSFAVKWATHETKTSYANVGPKDAQRKYAVANKRHDARDIDESAPFEIDAFRRALKWAHKAQQGETFSENRGTTCCAFVLACYHAAIVRHFLGADYEDLHDFLSEESRTIKKYTGRHPNLEQKVYAKKKNMTYEVGDKTLSKKPLRETSNVLDYKFHNRLNKFERLFIRKNAFMRDFESKVSGLSRGRGLLTGLYPQTHGDKELSSTTLMEGIKAQMGAALAIDAKYVHTFKLKPLLDDDDKWEDLGQVFNGRLRTF